MTTSEVFDNLFYWAEDSDSEDEYSYISINSDDPEYYGFDEHSKEYAWEKPAWIDIKLRETGVGHIMKLTGNLAAPITFTTFKNTDFSHPTARAELLRQTSRGHVMKKVGRLEKPILKRVIRDVIRDVKRTTRKKKSRRMRRGSISAPKRSLSL